MRIAICDDQAEERAALRQTLCALLPQEPEILEFDSGESLLAELTDRADGCQLIFLDVFMPGLNGMDTARQLRDAGVETPLAFLTSSREFAVDSYDVGAAGYMVKPIQPEKVRSLLDKFSDYVPQQRYLIYRKSSTVRRIPHGRIRFVESRDHRLYLHLTSGEVLDQLGRLDDLARELDDDYFLRCHQSYLVNLRCVARLAECFYLDSGETILIRRKDRKAICNRYYDWLMREPG